MATINPNTLGKLTDAMPGKQTLQSDLGALRTIQAVQKAPANVGPAGVSEMQAQLAAPIAQEKVQNAQANIEKNLAASQLQVKEQGLQAQELLSQKANALSQQDRALRERFNVMSANESKRLFDDTMQFKRDELGRTQWNEKQLIDWAVAKSKTDEELQNYQQIVMQGHERKSEIKQHAFNLIMAKVQADAEDKLAKMTQTFKIAETKLDQQLKTAMQQDNNEAILAINQKKQDLQNTLTQLNNGLKLHLSTIQKEREKQAAEDKKSANNTMMILQAAGTVAGITAVVATGGAAAPGVAALAAGGSFGGGAATLAGGLYNANK